jgi:hypothetical protein
LKETRTVILILVLLVSLGSAFQNVFTYMKPPLFFSPAYAQPSVWTDKSTYAVGETVTITMTYTQMMGVAHWVIVYKPDGSSFKLTFAQNSNSATTTADQAGDWRVELWSQVVAPNSTPTLQGTCTFTVTGSPCPQHIIYITVTTSKPVYNVGDTIVVLWDSSQIPQGATATLTLQGPSGTYNFNLDYSALMAGSYTVGQAEQKDVGQWNASLAGSAQSGGCPSPFQGSTTFQVGQAPPTTIATSSSTTTSCPIYLVPINVWTSKPVYDVGDEIVIFWSTGGGTPIYANGVLTLTGPSGTYNFNLDQNAMSKGQYDVGRAEQKDVGSWTVTLTVLGPPNCPPAGRGSTTFQVSQITTDLIASSCGTIPDSPKAGDSVRFWVDFNIVGGGPPYVFNYQMFLDGNLMQTLPSSPVQFNAAGLQSITTDTTWTATAGSHTERWVLNPDHMLQESNYSNNEVSCSFTVGGYQITLDSVATDVPAWVDGNPWPHVGSVTFAGITYSKLPATATAQSGSYDVAATPPSGECTGAGGVQCFSFVFDHWEIGEGVTQVDQRTNQNARVQVQGSGHVTAFYKVTTYKVCNQACIKSVTLNRNPAMTTQAGFFVARPPTPPLGDALYWMSGFGVWALISLENPMVSDFDGWMNVYLVDPNGANHAVCWLSDGSCWAVHVGSGRDEKYYYPISYHGLPDTVTAMTGTWHIHFELRQGITFLTSQLLDEKTIDITVVDDQTHILPLNAQLSAGKEIAVSEFLTPQSSTSNIAQTYKQFYDDLNAIFTILQGLTGKYCECKSDPNDVYDLDSVLPSPGGIFDTSDLERLIDCSASLTTSTEYLGNNQYRITVTYTVSAATLPPPDENVGFVPFYDRVHVHLYLPNGLQIVNDGGAFAVVPTNDGRQMVSWFDDFADKLLTSYGLPYPGYQVSHSVIVSISSQCLCDYPFESIGYFDVGPYSSETVKSDLPIIDYNEWASNPDGIAWILFATKGSHGSLSAMPGTSGQLEAIAVSSNSTILKVENKPDAGTITLTVSGPDGTRGSAIIQIPRDLVETGGGTADIGVFLDGRQVAFNTQESGSFVILTVSYAQSTHVLEIRYAKPQLGWIVFIKQYSSWIAVVAIAVGVIVLLRVRRAGPRVKEVMDLPRIA